MEFPGLDPERLLRERLDSEIGNLLDLPISDDGHFDFRGSQDPRQTNKNHAKALLIVNQLRNQKK